MSVVAIPPGFQHLSTLGEGGFGEVSKVLRVNSNKTVALKRTLSTHESLIRAAKKEEQILRTLNELDKQGFVVKVLGSGMFYGNYFMGLELMDCDFSSWSKRNHPKGVPLNIMKRVCRRLFSAMLFLKDMGIVHGDIKPNNLLISSDNPESLKITDFGMSVVLADKSGTLPADLGCLLYRSPDVILGYPSDCATDMWSMGLTLYTAVTTDYLFFHIHPRALLLDMIMLLGMPPTPLLKTAARTDKFFSKGPNGDYVPDYMPVDSWLNGMGLRKLLDRIEEVAVPPGRPHSAFPAASFYYLIRRTLTFDPAQRLTPEQALQHPFVR